LLSFSRFTAAPLAYLLLFACLLSTACTDQAIFTSGRIEDLCNGVVPVCKRQAGCILDGSSYASGVFPGEKRIVINSPVRDQRLRVRLLFTEMLYPGTELLAQAFSPDCGDVAMEQLLDLDFFEYAGDDRMIEFELPLPEAGDHLVELYSDMAADFLVTLDAEEIR